MAMEEEVIVLLKIGFLTVMIPVKVIVIVLMIKFKKQGFGWFLSHLLLLSLGSFTWIRLLETRAFNSSIYNSMTIAGIGIVWAISMVCFVLGLLFLSDHKKKIEQHQL